jgi:myo-inositol-1(or 4)-monophosphatase
LPSFIYVSEEGEPVVIGGDPLDTSELAVRGLNAYTQVWCIQGASADRWRQW